MVREMCYKLNKSSMLYKRLMSKHLERLDITYSQLMVLRVVNSEPGITAKEILMQMDTDKATLSGVLSRLERDNYIYRVKNEKDKRVQNIYVSEGSEKLCYDVSVIEKACIDDLVNGITEEESEAFIMVLDRFIANQIQKIEEKFKTVIDSLFYDKFDKFVYDIFLRNRFGKLFMYGIINIEIE